MGIEKPFAFFPIRRLLMKSPGNQSWQQLSDSLRENRRDVGVRIAILAAHPDDETIGASALLARSDDPRVIYLTDGAPRGRNLWSPDFQGSRQEYSSLRRAEAEMALSLAGLSVSQVEWLGGVDQEAIFCADHLTSSLAGLLGRIDPDVLVTHPYEGGHPDHDTAALVAHLAIHRLGQARAPLLVEMTSYHAQDGRCVSGQFLNGESTEELELFLSERERVRKAGMFAAYASQRRVLEGFVIHQERFRIAPEYDLSCPPHKGKLWYECMAWPMTGQQWRATALQKIFAVQELSCP
jgi:N-acetylglucosamine malate deacetylase 2